MRLSKAELVDLVEHLARDLEEARQAATPVAGQVSTQVAGWLDGLEVPDNARPIAQAARALAFRVDGEGDNQVAAQLTKELRASLADVRELIDLDLARRPPAEPEADPIADEMAGLKALRLA